MYFRPYVAMVMRNLSPYWTTKLVDLITAPWMPTEKMREMRELRRIVEIMDIGSKKAFAAKKADFATSATPAGTKPEVGDPKLSRAKDMMDIMRKFHNICDPQLT
jgi:hypothetical protein